MTDKRVGAMFHSVDEIVYELKYVTRARHLDTFYATFLRCLLMFSSSS